MLRYDHKKIESKWQKKWLKEKIYEPDFLRSKKPFYNLMMFPYPSAEGLHIGGVRTFTGVDIYGRMKRMQGHDVFEPIGLDGFGIHSENYALKIGKHPIKHAKDSEKNFYRQLSVMGNGFAWEERLETYDPEYYKWTQWIFMQMFKRGLAYRKKAAVNWCPSCMTVLADEQVIQKSQIPNPNFQINPKSQTSNSKHEIKIGVCERCDTPVIKKELEQWFFKITDYAERLLKNLDKINWDERIKIAQRNWIGRSEGALIKFKIQNSKVKTTTQNSKLDEIEVFTTRPNTLFGATYMVLGPEHSLIENYKLQITNYKEVDDYIKKAIAKTDEERIAEGKDPSTGSGRGKTGVELKGVKAINPANGEEIPVWVADYVLGNVGTGAIMAVPAHDQRDFEFAKKFNLPIKMVVCPHYPEKTCPVLDRAYEGDGHLVDSGGFNGMPSQEAKSKIIEFVSGQKKINYRLRDWLISRQRYWGPPIPMIFCPVCVSTDAKAMADKNASVGKENSGWQPVPEKDLPVRLPYIKEFRPTGTDKSPLATVEKFYKVRCPKCKSWARRETDVSDSFLDSAWYYIGYLMRAKSQKPKAKSSSMNAPWSAEIVKRWLPVHSYIGGAEHSVLHLLYSRFLAMAFYDWGMLNFEEPFTTFRAHGLITKDGAKMSKSKGNVVNPDEYIKVYGTDVMRMYLAFLAPLTQDGDFRDEGIRGITRFLERVWRLTPDVIASEAKRSQREIAARPAAARNDGLERLVHKTIKKVTEDIESLQYNTAISALMKLLNAFEEKPEEVSGEHFKIFLKLLAPFAPHMTEELWQHLDKSKKYKSIHGEKWPEYDLKLIQEDTFELIIQVNGKVRGRATLAVGAGEEEAKKVALAQGSVKKYISAEPRKTIFVPNKLVNFVV